MSFISQLISLAIPLQIKRTMQPGTVAPIFTASAYNSFTKEVDDLDLLSFKGSYIVLLFYTGVLADLMSFLEAAKEFKMSVLAGHLHRHC